MNKKSIFSLLIMLCLIVSSVFCFAGCKTQITGQEWVNLVATAQRNWDLVGNAKDTVESRTINYSTSNKNYDYEHSIWEETSVNNYIVRSGYGENVKYYSKITRYSKTFEEEESATREAYIGKISDSLWVSCVYEYVEGVKPAQPVVKVVATTAQLYNSYLNAQAPSSNATKDIFGAISFDPIEVYISESSSNLDEMQEFSLIIYDNIYNVDIFKENNRCELNVVISEDLYSSYEIKTVIENERFASYYNKQINKREILNDEGNLEFVVNQERISSTTINYSGTITMPNVETVI